VGPRLTFAFREAVFSLSMIERELLSQGKSRRLSEVREALDKAMLRNPTYWRSYYHGSEEGIRFARMYSYSDRCRYYWTDTEVQKELTLLYSNLANITIPPALVSQYFPAHAEAARSGEQLNAENLIREHIREVLRFYAAACSKG
jgi:D-tagatose-1,6-bisphosphate aldolase subunit GatZ/KbaZ